MTVYFEENHCTWHLWVHH